MVAKKAIQLYGILKDNTIVVGEEAHVNFKFPGFKLKKLTKLPNNLEPAQLWDSVLKVQTFKPDEEEKDHFFDRISDSFVALLLSTPNYIKDPFFQMYPDCLSQTIYITFCEAFPESHRHFNDEFKEELMDLVFQWIRGTVMLIFFNK
ncbi:hypothetical protein JD844_014459 [Phrynosoma platyrhinos]|uniref:Uncharacterized protein n=1 Tax=Phrynosoma platyrhinos TaxID=52577 RepID=A0ABQ7SRM7_PHRPL|nr:hypothetical protein JD844_014459 [Phrynosoma platyrhinos]